MAYPVNARWTSRVPGTTPISAGWANATDDALIGLYGGGKTVVKLQADGTGNQATTVAAGDIAGVNLAATGNVSGARLIASGSLGLRLDVGANAVHHVGAGTVTTTNNTFTSIGSFTIPNGKTALIVLRVVGVRNDNGKAAYHMIATGYRNDAGTLTNINATTTNILAAQQEDGWGGGSFNVSGATVAFQVAGAAATTIRWGASWEVTLTS